MSGEESEGDGQRLGGRAERRRGSRGGIWELRRLSKSHKERRVDKGRSRVSSCTS